MTDDGSTLRRAVARALESGLDKAVGVSRAPALKHIAQSRRTRPEATPAQIIDILGRRLTAATAATGTASGAAAAVPAAGLPAGMALAVGDAVGFTGLATMYVLALSEIYDVPVEDLERRRTLVMGVLLGDAGSKAINKVAAKVGPHWAQALIKAVPAGAIANVNKVLGHNFVTRYGTRQGVLVLGKQVPMGVGAVIGGAGNAVFAQFAIRSAKRAFGPPPSSWPSHLDAATIDVLVDAIDESSRHA